MPFAYPKAPGSCASLPPCARGRPPDQGQALLTLLRIRIDWDSPGRRKPCPPPRCWFPGSLRRKKVGDSIEVRPGEGCRKWAAHAEPYRMAYGAWWFCGRDCCKTTYFQACLASRPPRWSAGRATNSARGCSAVGCARGAAHRIELHLATKNVRKCNVKLYTVGKKIKKLTLRGIVGDIALRSTRHRG